MELKEITEKMLELLNVKSTEELSDRLFEVVKNNDMTIYEKFCEIVENDLSVDWMQMIFQYYQADRWQERQTRSQICVQEAEHSRFKNGAWIKTSDLFYMRWTIK